MPKQKKGTEKGLTTRRKRKIRNNLPIDNILQLGRVRVFGIPEDTVESVGASAGECDCGDCECGQETSSSVKVHDVGGVFEIFYGPEPEPEMEEA